MAPHHGSRRLDDERAAQRGEAKRHAITRLLERTRPALVVASQAERPDALDDDPYDVAGVQYLGTHPHGAITLRVHPTGIVAETFRTRERIVVRSPR
jgi:hypothetical protein